MVVIMIPKKNQDPISREMILEFLPCHPIPALRAHCFSGIGPVSTYTLDCEEGSMDCNVDTISCIFIGSIS